MHGIKVNVKISFVCLHICGRQVGGQRCTELALSDVPKISQLFSTNSFKFKRPPQAGQRSQTGLFYNLGNCLHLSKII